VIPKAPRARRTALAALSLVLAVAGAQVYTSVTGGGVFFAEVWPPVLLLSTVPAAGCVLVHARRTQRWLCALGAGLTGFVALTLFAYGYGVCQVPAVVALAAASSIRE
jgi:hypothetical protein